MTANDLVTVGTLDDYMRAVLSRLDRLVPAAGTAPTGPVVLYSLPELAQVLGLHLETVRLWLTKGKRGRYGETVKLQAYRFTSEARIPWPAVLAYHRGEPFDLDALPAPALPAPAVAAPTAPPALTAPPPGGEPVLRVA